MPQKPEREEHFWAQKALSYIFPLLAAIVLVGNFLNAISNSLTLITRTVTYVGTFILLAGGVFAHAYLRRHPMAWRNKHGSKIYINSLGKTQILSLLGAVVLLWVPMMTPNKKDSIFRSMALESIRGNLVRIDLRLGELRKTAESLGTAQGPENLRTLPDRLIMMGNLDMSFCRSLETHPTETEPEFAEAARGYCSAASGFSEREPQVWRLFKEDNGVQDVSRRDEIEAQVAVGCLLVPPERFYVLDFQMMKYAGTRMGLTERELLEGPKDLGLPDIPDATPYLEIYFKKRFRVECESGRLSR
jgi:hypothetical protein